MLSAMSFQKANMRYFRIFFLQLQHAIEARSLSVVWFLTALTTPLLMLIFWSGATAAAGGRIFSWSYSNFATYYLFIALASSMLTAHIEEDVAFEDINKGNLSQYILKPFPYYTSKFLLELPWRLFQGSLAISGIVIVALFFKNLVSVTSSPIILLLAIVIAILAFILSFTFKMILGLLAFWFTEISGVMNVNEIIFSIASGTLIPLEFFPNNLRTLFEILPFSYMIYYPIIAFLGKLNTTSLLQVILMQLLWIFIFSLVYKFTWAKGRKTFTAVGL